MYGVFVGEIDIHVVPCDKDGYILHPHTLDGFCVCDPDVQEENAIGGFLVVHNTEN